MGRWKGKGGEDGGKGGGEERGRGREGEGEGRGVAGPHFANFWIRPCALLLSGFESGFIS